MEVHRESQAVREKNGKRQKDGRYIRVFGACVGVGVGVGVCVCVCVCVLGAPVARAQ